uniref:Phospholipase C beta 2 n=1 Tax=Myripristis murdjan TaxID=586833 RepID=A0A667Z9R0_9TELE
MDYGDVIHWYASVSALKPLDAVYLLALRVITGEVYSIFYQRAGWSFLSDSTKTVPVIMKMDSKGYYLYWTNQSKETTFLDVATIRDTRTGKYAKLPKHPKVRNVFNLDFPDSNHLAKTLTIVSGLDTVNLTYHNFFASKEKVTQNWANDILAIVYNPARNNACRQIFLDKIYVRISLQTNKDGKIPVKTIYKMFPADKKRVESALASARLPKGKVRPFGSLSLCTALT